MMMVRGIGTELHLLLIIIYYDTVSHRGNISILLSPNDLHVFGIKQCCTNSLFMFLLVDLYIGFESSVYTASEIDPSVSVCIEVKDGQLGAAINIIMSIEGRSAQGT